MATLKKLLVALGLDKSDYDRGLDDASKKASSSAKDIGKSLSEIGDKMTGIGKNMSIGITAPVVAGFGLALNSASDLNETFTKTDAVFGDATDTVLAFSETADTQLGQSRQQALDAASTFGIFGKAAGLAGEDLSGFSLDLTSLASDFSSFYNASPDEAITAIGAALRGESEPIRRFGVLLDDATLKAAAFKMGLIDSEKDALSPQQKTLAAYNVIMEQSKIAQGDFARTSDGLANSTRITQAQLANTAATMGQHLLPIGLKIVQMASGLLERFSQLSPGTQKLILVVLGLAAGIGPLLVVVGTLISSVGAIIPVATSVAGVLSGPVLLVIGAVIAGVALLALAWKNNWGGIQEKTQAVIDWLKPFIDNALTAVRTLFDAFSLAFSGDWEGFGAKLREIWDMAWTNIKTAFSNAWNGLVNLDWGQLGRDIIQGLVNGLTGAVGLIGDAASSIGGALLGTIKGFFGIQSPSSLMEQEVGWNLGEGVRLGWQRSIRSLALGMKNDLQPVSVAAKISAGTNVSGGAAAPVLVNFHYQPTMSLADQYEAEQRIRPLVEAGVREELARRD